MHSMPSAGKHPLVMLGFDLVPDWLKEQRVYSDWSKCFPMLLSLSFQFQKVYIWTAVDWVLLFLWNFFHCKVFFHKLIKKEKYLLQEQLTQQKKEWVRFDYCLRTYMWSD